jgi:hypothetical protein
MRWSLILAVLALGGNSQTQENEAEKLYRGFEKKLLAAKVYKVCFDIVIVDEEKTPKETLKGDLTVAANNQLRLSIEQGTENDRKYSGILVCDGKQMGMKFTWVGTTEIVTETKKAPEQATAFVTGCLACAYLYTAVHYVQRLPENGVPEKVQLSDFKFGAKEKIGDRTAQIVEFAVAEPGVKNIQISAKLWFDTKTEVPLKGTLEFKNEDRVGFRITELYTDWQWDPKVNDDVFQLPK